MTTQSVDAGSGLDRGKALDKVGPKPTTAPMRILLFVASGFVFTVGIPLVFFPRQTETLFAWNVELALAAAFLGGGYWASFLLEFLSAREQYWSRARIAVPAVLLFTALTFIVTLQHLPMFHFGPTFAWYTRAGTWTWFAVYALVPIFMAVALVHQLRTPGQDLPRRAPMPAWTPIVLVSQGVVMLALGAALLFFPRVFGGSIWPWFLIPMNAQATGAWLIGIGVIATHAAWERDWLRTRNMMISYTAYAVFQLAALLRFGFQTNLVTGEPVVDWSRPHAWIYLSFLIAILAIGVYGWRASRDVVPSPAP